MNLHLMLILLATVAPKPHDALEVLPAPQVTCPLSLKEYSLHFRWWAREEVIYRQSRFAIESNQEIIGRQSFLYRGYDVHMYRDAIGLYHFERTEVC